MTYDTTAIKGEEDKPAVVFVHGLGMDKRIWESPNESRVLGGRFPVSLLVCRPPDQEGAPSDPGERRVMRRLSFGKPPEDLCTLFHDLKGLGFPVLAWSQRRPSAETAVIVAELREVLQMHKELCAAGIILVGHSRGGLVARKYVASEGGEVRALITLATPHRGSRMAQWAAYLSPLLSVLNPFLSEAERGTVAYTVKRVSEFLSSRAVKELLPDSAFFRSLDDGPVRGVSYLSVAGKDPTLLSVYRTECEVGNGRGGNILRSQKILSIPEVFEKLIPDRLLPDEMKRNKGDGLVSVESSRLPFAEDHYLFDVNHAGVLFDRAARRAVKDFLMRVV